MIKYDIEHNLPRLLTLKNRNRYLVEGWVVGPSKTTEVTVRVGTRSFSGPDIGLHRPDVQITHFPEQRLFRRVFCGFSIPVVVDPVDATEEFEVTLDCAFSDGSRLKRKIGALTVTPWQDRPAPIEIPPEVNGENLLVICMATYNPDPVTFKRQVDSIIAQDYRQWICLVCDDNSKGDCRQGIQAAIKDDPRFFFFPNEENVGFYHNFERCLELVPKSARYVALSDQDDIWYPNKLTSCLGKFKDGTMLVYCDMKIVDKERNVLATTYWKNRKNYYQSKDIDLLTIANTVTGAASVFRRELLDLALPFPPRYGEVFHDQWLAILAAGNGGIEYVDQALYEYVQYGDNVIGHSDFGRQSYREAIGRYFIEPLRGRGCSAGLARRAWGALMGIAGYGFYTFRLKHTFARHVICLAETALLRKLDPDAARLIRRIRSLGGLLRIHLKVKKNEETLNGLEYQLFFGELSAIIFRLATPLLALYVGSKLEKHVLRK